MILVDTSVLINYLKGGKEYKTLLFAAVLSEHIPYGISPYTYQEVLQGSKTEVEFDLLKGYLNTQRVYYLPQNLNTFEASARIYFNLRRSGITPRSTIDTLIALTAIHNNLAILHDDRDFDLMASMIKELRIVNEL
jgi:predicted nucleic acid-binding protein